MSIKVHAASFETCYWRSGKEYWHMFWNNVVLLCVWAMMCSGIRAAALLCYLCGQCVARRRRGYRVVHRPA